MDTTPCDLRTYLDEAGRGAATAIATALGVHPVMISQWAAAERPKPIPEDRAPDLERATGFRVRCETSCPLATWVRIPDPAWPHGKPLLDKAGDARIRTVRHARGTKAPASPLPPLRPIDFPAVVHRTERGSTADPHPGSSSAAQEA